MIYRHKKLITLLILLIAIVAYAADNLFLSMQRPASSLITAIMRDGNGFVWIGTENGLSRYDGYRFSHYNHIAGDSTSLSDNSVNSLLADSEGRVWVGTAHGLQVYDPETDAFHRIAFPDGRNPRIYSMLQSRSGDVMVGTAGFGLYTYRDNRLEHESKFYNPTDSDLFYTHIYEDKVGDLWQSSHLTEFTHFVRTGGKQQRKTLTSPVGPPVGFVERGGEPLLIVGMHGLATYNARTGEIVKAEYDMGGLSADFTILDVNTSTRGDIYLGTAEAGVWQCKAGEYRFVPMLGESRSLDLTQAHVAAVLSDADDNLWIGCYQKGLLLHNTPSTPFHTWSLIDQGYITGSGVTSVAAGADGLLWCIVENGGVYGFDSKGHVVAHPASPKGITTIYRDTEGHYWLTSATALYSYDPLSGEAQQRLTFTSTGVNCMADDGRGNLYLSIYSKGIYRYNKTSGEVKTYSMRQQTNGSTLVNDWVRDMCFDARGRLWLATSNGVALLDTSTDSFDSEGWTALLRGTMINSITTAPNGNVMIGTDLGAYRYDAASRQAVALTDGTMLANKQVKAMVADDDGNLWISTTSGLYQWNADSRQIIAHSPADGLTTHEYMQHAATMTTDRRVAFGMPDGLLVFAPKDVAAQHVKPGRTYLTNLMVDGRSKGCLGTDYKLCHNENSFELNFSTFDYSHSRQISYHYRINRDDWHQTPDGINSITMGNMSPGTYRIEVRAAIGGILSDEVTTIRIDVMSPWWASPWAYTIYVLALLLLAYYVFTTWEHRRRAKLDEQKMQFLINATHDIRSPLTMILVPLGKLRQHIDNADAQREINTIDRNAKRLLLLVNQILDERKIDKGQMKLQCEETDLLKFVRQIVLLYSYQTKERNISLTVDTDADSKVMAWIDHVAFDKVVNNLLSNSMKFTADGGHITITISQTANKAIVSVADDGIGLAKQDTSRIFERFYQGRHSDKYVGTGIGLNLVQGIVQLHGGTVTAHNRLDIEHGSLFRVSLPLGHAHLADDQLRPDEATTGSEASHLVKAASRTQPSNHVRLLLVDDDSEIRQYIATELADYYRFSMATNGREALQMLLDAPDAFDIVVSDVMMDSMGGIELLKHIKSNSLLSHIPVLLLTSKADVQHRLDSLRVGADAFIGKPFEIDELHVTIDNLVSNLRRLRGKFTGAQKPTDQITKIEVKGNNDKLMERITRVVDAHLSDSTFGVEQLADKVGLSRVQLHRKMKEITGISTSQFLRNLRMDQASRLIAEGKVNVTQVAYAVGFNNQAHFSTVFKKHFGCSPTEYAQRTNRAPAADEATPGDEANATSEADEAPADMEKTQ